MPLNRSRTDPLYVRDDAIPLSQSASRRACAFGRLRDQSNNQGCLVLNGGTGFIWEFDRHVRLKWVSVDGGLADLKK